MIPISPPTTSRSSEKPSSKRGGHAAAGPRRGLLLPLVVLIGACFLALSQNLCFVLYHQAATNTESGIIAHDSSHDIPASTTPRNHSSTTRVTSSLSPCRNLCECFHRAVTTTSSEEDEEESSASPPYYHLPSAASIWWDFVRPTMTHYQDMDIREEHKKNDTQIQAYRYWLDQIVQTLTPDRLEKALGSSPPRSIIQGMYQILDRRWRGQRGNGSHGDAAAAAPPLKIVVMGGSITAGNDFFRNDRGFTFKEHNSRAHAWPARLEHWINTLLGFEAVKVFNMAVPATTTDIATMILKYNLFPPEVTNTPDVLIWSFATNDNRGVSMTLPQKMQIIQDFMTQAHEIRCAPRSMLVMLDDMVLYPQILNKHLPFSSGVSWLAQWNDALGVTVARTYRDVALWNPQESALHEEWIHESDISWTSGGVKAGWHNRARVHPGLGIQIGISGILLYQLLRLATEFCQTTQTVQQAGTEDSISSGISHKQQWMDGHPTLPVLGNPVPDDVPLPPFHFMLDAREVLPSWKEAEKRQAERCTTRDKGVSRVPCSYAWVSNHMAEKMGRKEEIIALMDKIVVGTPTNWIVNGLDRVGSDRTEDKVGYEATGANATFVIEHRNSLNRDSIQKITIVCMHSYGPKWKDSQLQLVIQKKTDKGSMPRLLLVTSELYGFHRTETSIYFSYEIELKNGQAIEPGEILRMHFRLVGGTTFKILGLAFCSDH